MPCYALLLYAVLCCAMLCKGYAHNHLANILYLPLKLRSVNQDRLAVRPPTPHLALP